LFFDIHTLCSYCYPIMNPESFRGEVVTKREAELSQEDIAFINECSDDLMEIRRDDHDMDYFSAVEHYSDEEEAEYYEQMRSDNFNKAFDELEREENELAQKILTIPSAKRLFVLKKAKEAYLAKVHDGQPVRESTKFEKIDKQNVDRSEAYAKEIFTRIFRLSLALERMGVEAAK